jgi:hypothetical protein
LRAAAGVAQKLEIDSKRDSTADFNALRSYMWLPSPPARTDTAPGSRKTIWRGSVATRVNQEITPQKRIARVDEALRRLFDHFPLPRAQKR